MFIIFLSISDIVVVPMLEAFGYFIRFVERQKILSSTDPII